MIPHLLLAAVQDEENELKAVELEQVPIDGQLDKPVDAADQNAMLGLTLPAIILVVGVIIRFLGTRGGENASSGMRRFGSFVIGLGILLGVFEFVLLMIA